jgi:hypothetical protein
VKVLEGTGSGEGAANVGVSAGVPVGVAGDSGVTVGVEPTAGVSDVAVAGGVGEAVRGDVEPVAVTLGPPELVGLAVGVSGAVRVGESARVTVGVAVRVPGG